MEKPIRHVHVRRFAAPLSEVTALIDALWSGSAHDALPRALGGWRRTPADGQGFAAGTRFGHGPFSFVVEHWDGRTLRARIDTPGFVGHHGFELASEGERVRVTHDLDAQAALPVWIGWQLFVAQGHDWAVQALFDRMHVLLADGGAALVSRTPPLGLRAFVAARRLLTRAGGKRVTSART